MNDKKTTLIKGWQRPLYGDIERVPLHDCRISRSTMDLATRAAKELGMSRNKFVELALTSAIPGSRNWLFAERRYDKCAKERIYLKRIASRIRRNSRKGEPQMDDAQFELRVGEVLKDIAEKQLSGFELIAKLNKNGLKLVTEREANG